MITRSKLKGLINLVWLLTAILLLVPVQSEAIDLFGSKEKVDPVNYLPDDLHKRWLTLLAQPDTANIREYILEGQRV